MPIAVPADRARLYVRRAANNRRSSRSASCPPPRALVRIGTTAIDASHAYLSLDRSGRWLLGASYGGNSLSLYDAARVRATATARRCRSRAASRTRTR